MIQSDPFPKNFTWGAAAASYQVEGAFATDGRGLSVWDMLCRQPGRIFGGHTGDVACDHYHRVEEDVRLMKETGLQAYRFSISWSRVLPEGTGRVNEKGLAFYDRLVDQLLDAGIAPWATLFHWDFPFDLFCRGGWLNRDSAEWFAEYTDVVARRLGDRIAHWMTLNEPQCFIGLGHLSGVHAPGLKLGIHEVIRAGHHALLAHGRAVEVLRKTCPQPVQIGWAPVGVISIPASDSPEDIEAARLSMFPTKPSCPKLDLSDLSAVWTNSLWADPVIRGEYPAEFMDLLEGALPPIREGDMKCIGAPIDFYGTNIYNGATVRAGKDGRPETVARPPGFPRTAIKWPVTPESLYWGPRFLHERYGLPIVITENGLSCADVISVDGQVHDLQRIDFLHRYLSALARAIADGVPVTAYFQWSIMDNFEWAEGYNERFGLIYVDYETQKRTMKDSAHWYREVITTNGASLLSR